MIMATTKPEDILNKLVAYKGETESFREWFLKQFENADASNNCCLEEFEDYFLNSLRQNTEKHLKDNTGVNTPASQTPVRTVGPNVAATCEERPTTPHRLMLEFEQQETSTPNRSNRTLDSSYTGINERNEIMQISMGEGDFDSFLITSGLSTSGDHSGYSQRHDSSTPIKRNSSTNSRRIAATPTSSVSLGDFINFSKSNCRSHKKKNSSGNVTNNEKPKKRVQPITVCKKIEKSGDNTSSVFAGESSFSNDNNILKISRSEVDDKQQCSILAARKILKSNASEITKEIAKSPIKASTPTRQIDFTTVTTEEIPLKLQIIENNQTLKRLADIYTTLIDLSLVTNYLNELSFLLNLLSASAAPIQDDFTKDFEAMQLQNKDDCSKSLSCLLNINQAIGFALLCLNQQQHLIVLLDSKTLKVIMNNLRFSYLNEDVRAFIMDVYSKKQILQAENNTHESSFCFIDTKSCASVHFQQDQDSRQNFSSNFEFANFRVQRDLFYKCLKLWETNHLNPNWKFSTVVGPIIRDIFQQSELFVNMAHFANLFVAQLLLSSSNASLPEEIGVDVDMQKLNRLTQRLIAPSQFSVDYQFPRSQAFFRDFILSARSLAFAEQLKMTLYSELISMNDSSFEHINITNAGNAPDSHDNSLVANITVDQVAVRPEILNSMLILAKFLGFTISLPYTYNTNFNIIPTAVEKKQINLRTLIQPNFNLHSVVEMGIEEGKLLVTIPWMVQYIFMLDSITLQLEVHNKVLKLLFALNWYLRRDGANILPPTSKFIITSCLSWLFDLKQIITEQYYNFRVLQASNPNDMESNLALIKSKLNKYIGEIDSLEKYSALNPVLEALLPVACPFLGEFRVSIMPAKYASTKYASRSGFYRHITTRIADYSPMLTNDDSISADSASKKPKDAQKSLIQAFIHSQNSSTRQMITFCSERCYKTVVRDAQLNILLPCKSKADTEVNKIVSNSFDTVYKEIKRIYEEAHNEAFGKWTNTVPKMLDKRIKMSLDCLLPEETSSILKKIYFMVIKNNATTKISQWLYANIIKDNYFSAHLQDLANKICMAEKSKHSSELKIISTSPSPSELLSTLQYWLHVTSVRIELFSDSKPIVQLFKNLNESLKNVFPTMFYRLIASYTIQLLQNIIVHKCVQLTDELLDATGEVLLNITDDLDFTDDSQDNGKKFIYDGLISIAFFQSLTAGQAECYASFGHLVISLIKKEVISINYANDLFVALLKHDWSPSQLNEISNLLRHISQATAELSTCSYDDDCDQDEDDEKSNLFMDMLADLSRDVELF